MKIIVQFSGGKDSHAALIWAVNKFGSKNIVAQFSDTGWESEITYKHITDVCKKLNVTLITLSSKKYNGMVGLLEAKRRFPSTKARFCTDELKIKPFIDYVLDQLNDNILIIQGIRKSESLARSKMNEECRMFKYYLTPFGHDVKKTSKKHPNGKPKFHDYRKKEVLRWLKKYDDSILRPFFNSSGQDVINYILDNGHEPNELYKMGMKRVGCFPCINASLPQLYQLSNRFPDRINYVFGLENKHNVSFFGPGKIPDFAMKANNGVATIKEVETYIQGQRETIDMFDNNQNSCMSFYNICE